LRQSDGERTVWRFAVPLSAGDARGVAAVDLACPTDPDRFALGVATAPLMASLVGCLAVHAARVEGRTASGLVEVARELSRLLDPTDVVATALRRAMSLADAATGSIMLLDEESGKLVIADSVGLPGNVVARTALSEGEGIAGWVLSNGQPLLVEDLGGRPAGGRRHGVRSAASVPIGDDDGVLGVINVGSRGFPARFTESHLASLETLGKQTAVALRNARAVSASRELYFDTLRALAVALETKDPYARGATERVLDTALGVADVLVLGESERETLRVAALLHDIGMAVAGDSLALRHQPLSTVEQGLMKLHPQIAAEILDEMPALRDVVPVVYHHHEWYDGGGYLGGIAAEEIPLGARILAVADAYVALTSERPYRCAMERTSALAEIREKAGTQFDPAAVDALAEWLGMTRERSPERT
jgi:putative methionine-R-sulfoxide reductase with GAF domain